MNYIYISYNQPLYSGEFSDQWWLYREPKMVYEILI
jgi:hypothetical protein